MSDPATMTPAELGAEYRALEEDNRHHDTALLVARALGDAKAEARLTQIKADWEAGRNWSSSERWRISGCLFRKLVHDGRMIYP